MPGEKKDCNDARAKEFNLVLFLYSTDEDVFISIEIYIVKSRATFVFLLRSS